MNKEQLNRKLAFLLGYEIDEQGTDAMNRFITAANGVYDGRLNLTNDMWFNPCGNWDDIMPIALKFLDVSIHTFNDVAGTILTYLNENSSCSTIAFQAETHQEALTRCCIHALENQRSDDSE